MQNIPINAGCEMINEKAQELLAEYWQLAQSNEAVLDLYYHLITRLEADLRWARSIPKKELPNEKN